MAVCSFSVPSRLFWLLALLALLSGPALAGRDGEYSIDKADATPQGQDKVLASDAAPAPSGRTDQGSAPDKDRISRQDRDSRTPVLGQEYFLNENYYDRRNGWIISINKARMSCNISKLFDTKSLIQLGGDAHGSEYSFYLMFQDEKFFLEEGKKHAVSVTFNGRSTWDAEGLGVSLANGVLGVTLEHINKDSIVEFAGMSVLDLKIDGVSSGTYSLSGTRKALLRMLDCIKDIEAGRISLAAVGEEDRSADDRAPSTGEGPGQRGGQGKNKGEDAEASYAYGTGFFVNGDGYLLTNAHVVEGCKDALVRQGHSGVQPATIVAREVTNDLAILKIDEKPEAFGTFRGAPQIRLGDSIVVFGYPLAGMLSSTGNLSTGLISSLTGAGDDVSKLQISAPVQSGNSGGAVVDQSGRIVGVVVAKANIQARGTEEKPDIEVIQNVNFAIKAGMAQFFLDANQIHYEAEAPGADLKTPDVADIARSFTVQVACEMRK